MSMTADGNVRVASVVVGIEFVRRPASVVAARVVGQTPDGAPDGVHG
jgi:hypothetical protein